MKYCKVCGEELSLADTTIELTRRDGLEMGHTVRKAYQTLEFHVGCWEEIAGKEYTPGVELKELNWDNSVVYELGNYPDTGLFQKGDDLVIAAGGEPKTVIEGNAEIQGKLNLDCIDIDELKKKLGL